MGYGPCVFNVCISPTRSALLGGAQNGPGQQCSRFRRRAMQQSIRRCRLQTYERLSAIAGEIRDLPIFPLGLVAFPSSTMPLQIFEARYRVLFSTLLAGEEGIDDGLVQEESPYKASREFGINFTSSRGECATIGTVMRIQDFAKVDDSGRMFINTTGLERYRLREVLQTRPVLIARVEMLDDPEDSSSEAAELAQDISQVMKNILQLNAKMRGVTATPSELEPEELLTLPPRALSFWLGSLFHDSQLQQQELLEENSTLKRLQRERELLAGSLKFLQAAVALNSLGATAAPDSDAPGSDALPPPGGPD